MKFHQEFRVPERVDRVWQFFEQPLGVAECIPGVEDAVVLDADRLSVQATQKLGPMSATFDAKIRITERVHEERIAFTATGKAVRGAVGSFRTENAVHLKPAGDDTDLVVEGEAAMAGVLGTIGHKVITRQAEKVTEEFARNLERALAGSAGPDAARGVLDQPRSARSDAPRRAASASPDRVTARQPQRDPWAKAAAVFSAATAIIGLIILWRVWG